MSILTLVCTRDPGVVDFLSDASSCQVFPMPKQCYVYILANDRNTTLYIGVTSDLIRRVWEHKQKAADGFTKRYNIGKLVYFEIYTEVKEAIQRERQLKEWKRQWKEALIEEKNPDWKDLYDSIT